MAERKRRPAERTCDSAGESAAKREKAIDEEEEEEEEEEGTDDGSQDDGSQDDGSQDEDSQDDDDSQDDEVSQEEAAGLEGEESDGGSSSSSSSSSPSASDEDGSSGDEGESREGDGPETEPAPAPAALNETEADAKDAAQGGRNSDNVGRSTSASASPSSSSSSPPSSAAAGAVSGNTKATVPPDHGLSDGGGGGGTAEAEAATGAAAAPHTASRASSDSEYLPDAEGESEDDDSLEADGEAAAAGGGSGDSQYSSSEADLSDSAAEEEERQLRQMRSPSPLYTDPTLNIEADKRALYALRRAAVRHKAEASRNDARWMKYRRAERHRACQAKADRFEAFWRGKLEVCLGRGRAVCVCVSRARGRGAEAAHATGARRGHPCPVSDIRPLFPLQAKAQQERFASTQSSSGSEAGATWHIRTAALAGRTHPQPSHIPSDARPVGGSEPAYIEPRPNAMLFAMRDPPLAAGAKACTCEHEGHAARLARPDHLTAAIDAGELHEATESLVSDMWEKIRCAVFWSGGGGFGVACFFLEEVRASFVFLCVCGRGPETAPAPLSTAL